MKMKNKKMSSNKGINKLIESSGPYKEWSLLQRREFMELRLDQDQEIRLMYENVSSAISEQIASGRLNTFDEERLRRIQIDIKDRVDELDRQLTMNFDRYITRNLEVGSMYSKQVTIDLAKKAGATRLSSGVIENGFYRMNTQAVEAMWSRSRYGLKLNDQIWNKNRNYRKHINRILTSGVATGEDCVTVARALERYVKNGKTTFAEAYPNMMARMPGRVPEDLSYEALRLARTEMTSAFGMGTMKSAAMNPSNKGVRFILSASHPVYDICDPIVEADDYGLGPGGYPLDAAPDYPFHPNCLCIMTQIVADVDETIERLHKWTNDPASDPEMENWYQDNYEKFQFFN